MKQLVRVLSHNIVCWLTWGTEWVGSVEIWKQHALSSHGIQVGGLFGGLAKHPQVPPTHLKRAEGKKGYQQLLLTTFTPRKVKHTCQHIYRHFIQAALFMNERQQTHWEGKEQRNICWALKVIHRSNIAELVMWWHEVKNSHRKNKTEMNSRHPWARWWCLEIKHSLAFLSRRNILLPKTEWVFENTAPLPFLCCSNMSINFEEVVCFAFIRIFSAMFAHTQ